MVIVDDDFDDYDGVVIEVGARFSSLHGVVLAVETVDDVDDARRGDDVLSRFWSMRCHDPRAANM